MVKKEKIDIQKIKGFKKTGQKISALTAYDHPIARLLDEAGIDIILVGDSLGNVALGYRNTLPVTMLEMIVHTKAVSRAVTRALIVADMPFGSYQVDAKEAVKNAIALIKAGAEAVKVEGVEYIEAIKGIIKAGIPVMGHLGFTPQSVNSLGYRIQGKGKEGKRILDEARKLEKAGCFAIVLEMVPEALAARISKSIKIPTIGIGAGPLCDGQILVTNDLLGLYPNPPRFVKKRLLLGSLIKKAVTGYIKDNQ